MWCSPWGDVVLGDVMLGNQANTPGCQLRSRLLRMLCGPATLPPSSLAFVLPRICAAG